MLRVAVTLVAVIAFVTLRAFLNQITERANDDNDAKHNKGDYQSRTHR